MSNTLTAIIPTIYRAMTTVSREWVGFIPAVARSSKAEMASVGQVVEYPIVPQNSLENVTAGDNPADSGDQTFSKGSMTISNSKVYPIRWEGEEELALANGDDPQLAEVQRQQFEQAFRTIANAVESDLAGLYVDASGGFGTAGTTPFATKDELDDISKVLERLKENGTPAGDLHLVLGHGAVANLLGYQTIMSKMNEGGASARTGRLVDMFGAQIHESGQVQTHTAGTGASYQTAETGEVNETAIDVDTGSGTILAGDMVTFAGDTRKYGVDSEAGGTVTLNGTGLKSAIADNAGATLSSDYVANMAFNRNAIQLVARQPAMPKGGDSATDVTTIRDPLSGLVFQVARYAQYRRVKLEIGLAWGVETVNEEHVINLLG